MATVATLEAALERYEPVIGLEVHAQLKTRSKLFSSAPNRYDPEHPNQAIRAYCIGLPGQLPVLNERAVDMAITTGLALGCEVQVRSTWARKQYFYPDLPKGYQISQYDQPICTGGHLEVAVEGARPRRIGITRIHMEEDAGKSIHVRGEPRSLVDYSRAGVPLLEIVSEPDLRSAAEAAAYLRELRSILRTLEVCDGNMEQGSFRCDANVSIRLRGEKRFGTRVELKNINSFRFVEQAIDVEIVRHAQVLEDGGTIVQETRLYDSGRRETRSMRGKEEAADYRYFPDPDLPPLILDEGRIEARRRTLPELPAARRTRWRSDWGIPVEHAQAFSEDRGLADFFDAAVGPSPALATPIAHLIKTEMMRALKEEDDGEFAFPVDPQDLRELLALKEKGKLSSPQVKKLFQKLYRERKPLSELLKDTGEQITDPAVLLPMVEALWAAHPKEADKLKAGQKKVLGFFVGQVMKQTKGQADPAVVNQLLLQKAQS